MKNGKQGEGGGRPAKELSQSEINQVEALAAVLTKGQASSYHTRAAYRGADAINKI